MPTASVHCVDCFGAGPLNRLYKVHVTTSSVKDIICYSIMTIDTVVLFYKSIFVLITKFIILFRGTLSSAQICTFLLS